MTKKLLYGFTIFIFSVSSVLAQWMDSSEGLTPSQYYTHEGVYYLANNSSTIYASTFHSVFYSTDGGANWIEMANGLPSDPNIESIACNESTVLVQTKITIDTYAKFDLLKWNGSSWQNVIGHDTPFAEPIRTIIYSGTDWYAKTYGKLIKSTDDGETWTEINSIIFPGDLPDNGHFLAYRNGKMYLGAEMGIVNRPVHVSTDDGLNWSSIDNLQGSYIYQNSNAIYVVGDSIFKSTDDSSTWSVIHCNAHSLSLWVSGDTLVQSMAGGNGSAFYSIDGGDTWNAFNEGLPQGNPSAEIRNIISFSGNFLAGVRGNPLFTSSGVYARPIDFTTTGVQKETEILENYHLSQNYPNPFNPSTKISWQSPVSSHQTLKVYDILGNEVATLVNEYKSAGKYEVEFNGEELPSGVYFYQLRTGSFVETKKMLLLR